MANTDSSKNAVIDIFRLIDSGQTQHAESQCRSYLAEHPDDVNILGLLGAVLMKLGQNAKAKPILEKTIRLEPLFAKPYEDLGMLCLNERDPGQAIQFFEKSIRLDASQASAYSGLATALAQVGENEAAEEARQKYLGLSPVARALSRADSLLEAGQSGEAEKICSELSRQYPTDSKVLRMLARIASKEGRHVVAEGLLKRIVKLSENDHRCYVELGLYLAERRRYPEAIEFMEKAVALEPSNISIKQRLGDFLAIVGRSSHALEVYEAALELKPEHVPALVGRGHMLRILGRPAEAIKSYESGITIRPDLGDAWWSLASLRKYRFSAEQIDELKLQVTADSDDTNSKISFHFALARACEADDDFDGAWTNYDHGNLLKRSNVSYDPVQNETSHDKLIEFFSREFLDENSPPATDPAAPIFIVGMPRSGSTLLEQILASHSQVEGAAELPYMESLADSLGGARGDGRKYPSVLEEMTADQLKSLGKSYIYYAQSDLPQKLPRFTDKMPANFTHVGLIHLALPNAKIIDARRHPLDACIGNFRQLFAKGKNHAYDIYECAEYYQEYVRLMAHWDEVLPGRVLKVQYEDVVADIEGQTRRMLEYCELPWEDACLNYYETSRPVNTASSDQVRVPIFGDAVGYWKNYESQLGEAKEILANLL
jgi:tetratricopeptide (TPR) repeat protein